MSDATQFFCLADLCNTSSNRVGLWLDAADGSSISEARFGTGNTFDLGASHLAQRFSHFGKPDSLAMTGNVTLTHYMGRCAPGRGWEMHHEV